MPDKKTIEIPETISVRTLAGLLEIEPTKLIAELIKNGVMASINQSLDFDTAVLVSGELGVEAVGETKSASHKKTIASKSAETRAPVVTIMGHVDHGKTSLLDFIRKTNVTAGESGGITQHISAYQIDFTPKDGAKQKITFIDTPGHEAFSALRSHGASITDLVVLVVAADDGVKPQTIEAITHAKAANVPIIVAINKIDVPGANVERIKQQLTEHELVAEEWGGKTVMAPISAKTGEGIEYLLEMIVLATDLLELKADIDSLPEGVVIEANLDKQVGPLTTLLIFSGTLRAGQIAVVGKTFGRIRSLHNDRGEQVSSAGPSQPVVVTGLKDVPQFGDQLAVVPNEKIARSMTASGASAKSQGGEGGNTIRIILKADVGGSLAALEDSISKIKNKDATVEIISSGIGQVTENDITRAKTAGAIVIAFRLPVQKRIQELADQEGVTTKEYWIIYEAVDFLNTEVRRIATPTFTEVELGRLKVLAIFGEKGKLQVVGGEVTQGEAKSGVDIEVFRAKELLGQGKVTDLRVGKVAVDKVGQGEQCGLSVEDAPSIEKDDLLVLSEQRPD